MWAKFFGNHRKVVNPCDWSGLDLTGSTSATSIMAAAIAEANSNGYALELPAGRIACANLTIPDRLDIYGKGMWKTVLVKNANGPVLTLNDKSNLSAFGIECSGASFTGVGVTINATTEYAGEQQLLNMRIEDSASYALEYNAPYAGYSSYAINCLLKPRSESTYAVKWGNDAAGGGGPAGNHGYRGLIGCEFPGNIVDATGTGVGFIIGCISGGSPSLTDLIKMSSTTAKIMVIGSRLVRGIQVHGVEHCFSGNTSHGAWVFGASCTANNVAGNLIGSLSVAGDRNAFSGNYIGESVSISGDYNALSANRVNGAALTLASGAQNNSIAAHSGADIVDSSGSTGDVSNNYDLPITSYTPAWTADSGTPAVGSGGSLTGHYVRRGRTITATVNLSMGTSPTLGTGQWYFSLPKPAHYATSVLGSALALDAGVNYRTGIVRIGGGGSTAQIHIDSDHSPVRHDGPFSWGTGDSLIFTITYDT